MAIPVSIDQLINDKIVESNRIEYKADFNPDAIIRTICAFANDIDNIGGGYIIVGVEEKDGAVQFPIKGISKNRIDTILKKMREYCHFIEPLYEPIAEPVYYQDAYIIVIWVSGGYGRPYKAPKEVTSKRSQKYYYIRKFSGSVIASPEEERELFYVSSSIPFDDRPNLAADVRDLDIALLRAHLREVGSELYPLSQDMELMEIARSMQLIEGPEEDLHPRNVGILMFSEKIHQYFRYARIEVVDIPEPEGNHITEKTFTGPIQRQLTDALSYIRNYTIKERIIKTDNKAEADHVFNYPFRAIEEILSNAVYHRSYQISEPIVVRIEPESIEIISHPGFDRSITDEKIQKGDLRARVYRNRRIGDYLKELHLIEGRNTGFPNARTALKKNGSDMFQIEMDPDRSYLSVTIPVHKEFSGETGKSKDYKNRILAFLNEPKSLTELAAEMGYKGITAKLSRTISSMERKGLIRKTTGNGNRVKYVVSGKQI